MMSSMNFELHSCKIVLVLLPEPWDFWLTCPGYRDDIICRFSPLLWIRRSLMTGVHEYAYQEHRSWSSTLASKSGSRDVAGMILACLLSPLTSFNQNSLSHFSLVWRVFNLQHVCAEFCWYLCEVKQCNHLQIQLKVLMWKTSIPRAQ